MNIIKFILPAMSEWFTFGLDSVFGGGSGGDSTNPSYYDPFSDYRDRFAKIYSGYLTPGAATNIYNMPGYTQFQTGVLDPSMAATKRSMAASGQFNSGREQIALQDIASRGYSGFLNSYLDRLGVASGAGVNPVDAGRAASNAGFQQNQNIWSGIGALASIWSLF